MLRRLLRRQPPAPPMVAAPAGKAPNLAYRQALALAAMVPELAAFGLEITPGNAGAVLDFFHGYLPLIRPESRGAYTRSLLFRLRAAAPDLSDKASIAIARSDLADGIPDRAKQLRGDPDDGAELDQQTRALEAAYGAALLTEEWPGASRGSALLFYLQNNPGLVTGKEILHIAPEPEPRQWLESACCSYRTLDGSPDTSMDLLADITDLPIAEDQFDLVICHRVLEHVLNDLAAMREMHRVLRPGGVLNLSVPQAAHRAVTAEWMVPDASHHDHVRHYGADLTARLERAGFTVACEPWLLTRPREELLARNAFPMRMFNARKGASPPPQGANNTA